MNNVQKNHFNSLNNYSEKGNFDNDPRIKLMLKQLNTLLENNSDYKVLDVGVADGYIYRNLTKDYDIYGVDISENFIECAKKNGVTAHLCDLENNILPFEDNFFDIIVTGETVEHVVNSDHFFSEINRVLKKDGYLIISYPNINTLLSIVMMMFFDLPPMYSSRFRSPHVRDWTKKTMIMALKIFGFKVEKVLGAGFYLPIFGFFNVFGLSLLFPRFSYSAVVLARKSESFIYDPRNVIKIKL